MQHANTAAKLALASLLTTALSAGAAEYPKQIQLAIDSGVKVVRSFPAASHLKGWVLSKEGQYSLVFTTPDGKTLLAGDLIDESGHNLTAEYGEKYVPKPDLNSLFQELEHRTYLAEGTQKSPKAVLYVFFDPDCPYCHLTWKALQPYEKVGLQVRWVPVAYLKPSSLGRAAAIMAAKDRVAAFRENEVKFDARNNEGGLKPLSKPSQAIASELRSNMVLLQKFGAYGTPALVWKDKGGKIEMKGGMPRLSELPGITGLPEQKSDDPDLAHFR